VCVKICVASISLHIERTVLYYQKIIISCPRYFFLDISVAEILLGTNKIIANEMFKIIIVVFKPSL